ncbi:MAG TPA: methyltransferase domain-containing protein, partial [Rhodothermales bacterium]|nr:methyltransferase domain-containing protein [Rhodothermales bacterium]
MAVDHSLTYRTFRFRNLGHRSRLRTLRNEVLSLRKDYILETLADFGCSNGYLTALLQEWSGVKRVYGFDVIQAHLRDAQAYLPDAHISFFDLNTAPSPPIRQASLVCCLETLEHTGNLENALRNVLVHVAPSGVALLSLPIEIGMIGLVKFLLKTLIYRDSLDELPSVSWGIYLRRLLSRKSVAVFRDQRTAWSTHFGFDWREVDDLLHGWGIKFQAKNKGTARIYTIPGTSI